MAASNIVTLTQGNFEREVLQSATPVLVDFWAERCGPCKMMAAGIDELAAEFGGRAKIAKIDVDDQLALAANFRVNSIPTFLMFRDGHVVAQHVGAGGGKSKLKSLIDGALT